MRKSACKPFLARVIEAASTTQNIAYTRCRGVMPPAITLVAMMCMTALGCRPGYEGLMIELFTSSGQKLGWTKWPAASTFCRARKKLTADMFEAFRSEVYRLGEPTLEQFLPRIRGMRVVAIDGSWISVPSSKILKKALGIHRIGPKRCPMGKPQVLMVSLTDAMTRMPIARVFLPGNGSERAAALELMKHLSKTDILLADRGYHGREMLAAIQATGCRYVLRVTGGHNGWKELRGIQKSRIRDVKVTIQTKETDIEVRHIRISGGPGRPRRNCKRETMYLLTNLPTGWSVKRIGEIYLVRWGIETMFRELKVTLETDRIHSRSLSGVHQELDATSLHLAIAVIIDMETILLRRKGTLTNRTLLLQIIAVAFLSIGDEDVISRCFLATCTASLRAPKKRKGRWAQRKPKMFK